MPSGQYERKLIPMPNLRHLVVHKGWRLRELSEHFGASRQTVLDRIRKEEIPYDYNKSCPGSRNGFWRGGLWKDNDGYWMVHQPDHPHARKSGCVLRSRLVMEKKLGRYLRPNEVVHHIDNDKNNDHPNNLRVYASNGEHLADTIKGQVPRWTEDGKRRIAAGIRRSVEMRSRASRTKSKIDVVQSQQSASRRRKILRRVRPAHDETDT